MLHRHRTFKMLKDIQIALLVQKFILPTGGVALGRVVTVLFWKVFFWDFFTLWIVLGYFASVLARQPTVHSGRASRGRVFGCTCWHWWHVTCSTWYRTSELWHFFFGNFILFVCYQFYYLHMSWESVSRVCGDYKTAFMSKPLYNFLSYFKYDCVYFQASRGSRGSGRSTH